MDYVKPLELISSSLEAAEKKATLAIHDLLIRGFLSGVFLGYATSLAMLVSAQGLPPIAGAIIFPVGFVMLVLLGLELATGSFAILPQGLLAGRVKFKGLLHNWSWVYLGNLIGCTFYALLFYIAITNFGTAEGGAIGEQVRSVAEKKTLVYKDLGFATGWGTSIIKAILANWMVTIGTMLAFVSKSTIGKIFAMWLPIMVFFAHGYEHSIVNMFVIPAGMIFGAPISAGDWWLWNQIPVTIGNIISGALFTGVLLYITYTPKK